MRRHTSSTAAAHPALDSRPNVLYTIRGEAAWVHSFSLAMNDELLMKIELSPALLCSEGIESGHCCLPTVADNYGALPQAQEIEISQHLLMATGFAIKGISGIVKNPEENR